MSKRRINQQQSRRIQKIQADYRQDAETNRGIPTEEGLILTRFGRHAEVETKEGKCIHCLIRPHIDSLVAGDRVIWQPEGVNQGVVVSRYPRSSILGRPDKRGEHKVVAANITQLMVVVAAKPDLTWSLLDSYLVMAEHLALPIGIILNKIDLPCEEIRRELIDDYSPLGYPLLFTSQENHQGYDALQAILNQQVSVFVGQSGVGKSSLIAALLPQETMISTMALSTSSGLGCHTTSNSRFYHLPQGGALIDSPGVREFSLWQMTAADIAEGYREFRPLIPLCKFRDCTHYNSPGCAVIAALKEGKLSKRRYDNFIKMTVQGVK